MQASVSVFFFIFEFCCIEYKSSIQLNKKTQKLYTNKPKLNVCILHMPELKPNIHNL